MEVTAQAGRVSVGSGGPGGRVSVGPARGSRAKKPPAPPPHVKAVSPADMAANVSRRPTVKWALPSDFAATVVSVTIFEIGQGDDPRRLGGDGRELAFISGVSTDATNQLDLFAPPGSTVETGDLRRMAQLAPQTWYKWRVRALAGTDQFMEDDFYFKTGAAEAPLPANIEGNFGTLIPPMPQPLPPQPIDSAGTVGPKKSGR